MKRLSTIFLSLLLIFSIFTPMPNNAEAAIQSESKLRVLEIVDSGSSQIGNYLEKGNPQYIITPMTMKKFVAMREELDGKYDVIAIMDGTYTNAGVVKKEHDTRKVMNDITNLKANEIINDFINKGQPVIFHRDSIETGKKLKENFGKYLNNKPSNVFIFKTVRTIFGIIVRYDEDGFNQFIKNGAYMQAPKFNLSQKPDDKMYVPNNKLEFTMNVTVPADVNSRSLKAKLYIDSNFDDKYTTDEIVAEKDMTSSSSTISYVFPKGYSGVRYWKLELVDSATNLKSYDKGMIKFKDKIVDVKVLQVTKNIDDVSSLTKTKIMNQSFLKPSSGEYNIAIDVVNIGEFNKTTHNTINGKYDMVIFGFADVYNDTKMEENAIKSLRSFINSGQSIMFTHDTIYKTSTESNWVEFFKDDTGQIDPKTDLGLNAVNTSKTTKKVNEGLMTEYPYKLGDNIAIALTHNQYYTLNLEDPEVIPWYNITSASNRDIRDENDSWNHYYTYSKGNITYSGTGHTSNLFPEEEQKLFVNTMYRAFLGSNHAPEITVHTPTENQIIPTNQNIELSYTLQDYDLKDKKVSTKVFLNDKLVLTTNDVTNGTTINESLRHAMPNGGEVVVKIQATDASGAMSEKVVKVLIQKITASLEVNRSIAVPNPVKTGEPIMITYTVTPQDITDSSAKAINTKEVEVKNLKLIETFPSNMKVNSDGIQTGSEQAGIQLEKTLPSIKYIKSGDKFSAVPITFTIQVTPTEKGQYALNNSVLSYTDLNSKQETPAFNSINFFADVALTGIQFPEKYILSKGSEKNFSIDLKMLPDNAGIKEIIWSEESGGNNLTIDPKTGVAKVIKEGETVVKVKVTDNFGNVKEASSKITVRIPVEDFTVNDLNINIGQTLPLPITAIKPEDGKSSLTITLNDKDVKDVALINNDFTITGLKEGKTELVVSGTNSAGDTIKKSATINVKSVPVTNIIVTPNGVKIDKSEIYDKFKVTILPDNATNKDVVWTSLSPTIASVIENGKIKGIATGEATLKVTTPDGKVTTNVTVKVGQPLTSISIPTIQLNKGDTQQITYDMHPADSTNIIKSIEYAQVGDDYSVKLDKNTGIVTGQREGESKITVTVTDEDKKSFTAEGIVKVSESGGSNDDDKY